MAAVTTPIEDRDFAEWHGGCRHALVWVIDVDVPAVREAVAEARARLGGLLYPRYDRRPHVTVAFCGLAPEHGATPADLLYGDDERAADLRRLDALGPSPFTLRIDGWDTFTTSPHLSVVGIDYLLPLHEALTAYRPSGADIFVPHVTVGLYGAEVALKEVEARMAGWSAPPIDVDVTELVLARYNTADILGPLTEVSRFRLA
ncbi:MAG: 2'-5' RNA ligase family protein [Tessaracoccus sp.]|uniref:2'-5' RNA ligase family protein n=1 Tax=Tessaracoccus sp. TaxID=1971211 RepID=UPI001ECD9F09|nr:2'-5' RNA ligase family protein [Tessaracoccus sp.]MBK7822519.1 2'-5' RNA ligase family protein [Tessaracoccus sp.]